MYQKIVIFLLTFAIPIDPVHKLLVWRTAAYDILMCESTVLAADYWNKCCLTN